MRGESAQKTASALLQYCINERGGRVRTTTMCRSPMPRNKRKARIREDRLWMACGAGFMYGRIST